MGEAREQAGGSVISIAAFGLAVMLVLPILTKPIHIDDPVVLAVAENVLHDPTDPLAGRLDWLGEEMQTWRVTTNPPLLSYWLAPVLAWFGPSEIALHLGMLPFLIMLAGSQLWLAQRFCGRWMPALFVLASPAIVVSINLMRDVPAAALASAGLALVVFGSDRQRAGAVLAGALLLGGATVTKYSAAVLLPVALLYVLQNRGQDARATLAAGLPLLLWCVWSWWLYGIAHPLFLMSGEHANRTFGPLDKSLGALAILGSCLLLAPALLARARPSRVGWAALGVGTAAAVVAAGAYRGELSWQYSLWIASGTVLLWLAAGAVDIRDGDDRFLLLWLAAPLLFSVFLVPFQAVRHLIVVFTPLCLLAFKRLDGRRAGLTEKRWQAIALRGLLTLQVVLAGAVAYSDHAYAACYRDAARSFSAELDGKVWFVGHWGWKHYAEQAGFEQLHRNGPAPAPGDLLIRPRRVHVGPVFQGHLGLTDRLTLIREDTCGSRFPVRTMNFEGAAFYAVIRANAPFAFQRPPLETFRVYRVEAAE